MRPFARRPTLAGRRAERSAVEDPAVVLDAAARLLEARARSVHEVRRRLSEAGYQGSLIEPALTRLQELGLLDDEAFARAWVESRDRAHPRGARVLREELRRKGLAAGVIDTVLADRDELALDGAPAAEVSERRTPGVPAGYRAPGVGLSRSVRSSQDRAGSSAADETAARRLLERNASALARVADPRKRRQRAYGLLARNGFDPEIAGRLIRLLDAADPDVTADEGPSPGE